MIELIAKIVEYYPQLGVYALVLFLVGWVVYKISAAFDKLNRKIDHRFIELDHKIDHRFMTLDNKIELLSQKMATKEDLAVVQGDLNAVKTKVGIIEEKVDVLWKRQTGGNWDYGFPLVREGG